MKIAILTTFYEWSKAYSLTSVVENQLIALKKHGYEPILFVHDNFKDDDKVPEGVEVRKVIPRFNLIDYSSNGKLDPNFDDQVSVARATLEKHLKDVDVVLTHDLIFQGWFLIYNVAMRQAQPNLKCRWLHWVHSAPSPRPNNLKKPHDARYKMMKNSKLIYMNNIDTLRLAEMYAGKLDDIRVVYNPLDLRSFNKLDPFVERMIDKYKLLEADIIDVYPVSSTRFDGKQVKKAIKIMAALKGHGRSVRFICCNAHANAQREKDNIARMIQYGIEQGLSREDIIFTSVEEVPDWELGVPHHVVRDFLSLSNLFLFPTKSENCPLILLEAAASKCLLVLNESFAPLRDFFGKDALYFKFGSLISTVSYNDEDQYYKEVALIILGELEKNKPLNAFKKLKQKFNFDWIFKHQLEPLFFEKLE